MALEFFAGAESDIGRFTVTRPLSRVWAVFGDAGYARNSRVQAGGYEGTEILVWFCRLRRHRQLGHELRVYGELRIQ